MPSCINCGSENEEDLFCSNCGARIQPSVNDDTTKTSPQPVPNLLSTTKTVNNLYTNNNQSIPHFYNKIFIYYLIAFVFDIIAFYVIYRSNFLNGDIWFFFLIYSLIQVEIFQYFFNGDFSNLTNQRRLLYLFVPTINFLFLVAVSLIIINNFTITNPFIGLLVAISVPSGVSSYRRLKKFSSAKVPQKYDGMSYNPGLDKERAEELRFKRKPKADDPEIMVKYWEFYPKS